MKHQFIFNPQKECGIHHTRERNIKQDEQKNIKKINNTYIGYS